MDEVLSQIEGAESRDSHSGSGTLSAKSVTVTAPAAALSVAQSITKMLEDCGVTWAFGVSGGAMATLWEALSNSRKIQVLHCRHEAGAAFAAAEASLVSDRPVAVFTTAGPGFTNALTGLFAARGEGAKVIAMSACTSSPQRGRWAIQETSVYSLPMSGLYTAGALFNDATVIESADQLPQIARRIASGLARPEGYVAHLSVPTAVQSSPVNTELRRFEPIHTLAAPSDIAASECADLLSEGPFAIWVGFGARHAAPEIRQLAERTGAAVMCSPRGKGIFPEHHPQFVGVTGLGGHASVMDYLEQSPPLRTLVLGTRLGEPTSFWSQSMVPAKGFIHVDIDPAVPGVAFPTAETLPIQADVGAFLRALLQHIPANAERSPIALPNPEQDPIAPAQNDLVRPEILMEAIQRVVVEGSDATVLAESGNSFTWSTNQLRFAEPNRYRVSTGVGSMGHMVTGVIGAAQGRSGKAVVITGDGSMMMNNEINTAVKYQIPAVWIVLNDARYNMCAQGMALLGLQGADPLMPPVNFVALAQSLGADGVRVEQESELQSALEQAIAASTPFVVDVIIDPERPAPSKGRNRSLIAQGAKSDHATPDPSENGNGAGNHQVSFPLV